MERILEDQYERVNNHAFEYILSLLVPLFGFILGAILIAKEDVEQKRVGKNCAFISLIPTIIVALFAVL